MLIFLTIYVLSLLILIFGLLEMCLPLALSKSWLKWFKLFAGNGGRRFLAGLREKIPGIKKV
jgi:hypothetical protein